MTTKEILRALHKQFQLPRIALRRCRQGRYFSPVFAEYAFIELVNIEHTLSFILKNYYRDPQTFKHISKRKHGGKSWRALGRAPLPYGV